MQLSLKILTILTFSFSYNSILFTEHNFGIFKKSFVSKNWFNLFPKVSISLNTSFLKWHFTYFRVLTWYGTVQNKQFTGFKYIKIAGASRLCPWTTSGGIRAPNGDQQPWNALQVLAIMTSLCFSQFLQNVIFPKLLGNAL